MKAVISIFLLMISWSARSQIVDHLSLNLKVGQANQFFAYANPDVFLVPPPHEGWQSNRSTFGLEVKCYKNILKNLDVGLSITYLEKGYKFVEPLRTPDSPITTVDSILNLPSYMGDIRLRYYVPIGEHKIWVSSGIRIDYAPTYDPLTLRIVSGRELRFRTYGGPINPWSFGTVFSLGFEYKSRILIGIDYNPSFTPTFEDEYFELKVTNRYVGLSVGYNFIQTKKKRKILED